MKYKKFEDLPIFKEGINIIKEIYKFSQNDSIYKDFGLRDQIRRASVSIISNIAEGLKTLLTLFTLCLTKEIGDRIKWNLKQY